MINMLVPEANNTASYAWLEQLSQMNNQIFMISNKDMNVDFVSQYTLDFLEIEFNLEDLPSPLPYKLMLTHLARHGYFGDGKAEDLIAQFVLKNQAQLIAGPSTSEELDLITPSGRRVHVKQIVTDDGRLLLVGNDVTQDYIENHALELALASNRSGYGIYNPETKMLTVHGNSVKNYFALDAANNMEMKDASKSVHPDDRDKCYIAWHQGLKSGKPWEITYRVFGYDGHTLWIKSHYTPQLSKDGQLANVIWFFTDVTDTIRVQSELRKVTERTQNTLRAKTDFIGRLSHEMRTPMNAVIGIADALIHGNTNPAIHSKLELIQTSTDSIVRILDETLNHAKLEEHKVELNPHNASPQKCVETICHLWEENAVKNNITLSYEIDKNVPEEIYFDDYKFEQCLNNLLSNAIKFTSGGQIKVIQTLVKKGKISHLITAVKDNGIGMTPAQQSQIFEAFTQADSSISSRFGGTGLGMSITKNIIELMGGRISLNSVLGQGSVFALSLPIKTVSALPESGTTTPARPITEKSVNRTLVDTLLEENAPKPSKYGHLKILIVDDNPTNHLVVKSLLETLVGEITPANNGVEAIQALEAQSFDLVFMDIHMPIMDGIEATLAIRNSDEVFSNTPIIALTADPQYQQKRLCKNIGMDGALGKPVRLSDLLGAIDKVMESRELAMDAETNTESAAAYG